MRSRRRLLQHRPQFSAQRDREKLRQVESQVVRVYRLDCLHFRPKFPRGPKRVELLQIFPGPLVTAAMPATQITNRNWRNGSRYMSRKASQEKRTRNERIRPTTGARFQAHRPSQSDRGWGLWFQLCAAQDPKGYTARNPCQMSRDHQAESVHDGSHLLSRRPIARSPASQRMTRRLPWHAVEVARQPRQSYGDRRA